MCSDCQHEDHESGSCSQCFCGDNSPKASSSPVISINENQDPESGSGNANARLMIVKDYKHKNEQLGDSFLDRTLLQLGSSRSEVFTTYAARYINGKLTVDHKRLWSEIRDINPNCLMTLGPLALESISDKKGLIHYRGSILQATDHKYKFVAGINPYNFISPWDENGVDYIYSYIFKHDLKRALDESVEREYNPPIRNLTICKSSKQLRDYIARHRNKNRRYCAVDIESTSGIPTCIGLAFTPEEGMSVPILNVQNWYNEHGIGDHDLNDIWLTLIEFFSDPYFLIIGHNFKYDQEKIQNVCGIAVHSLYADTMLMHAILYPELPQKLEFLCSTQTREPFYKLEGKEYNPKKDPIDRLFLYNAKDCVVTIECFLFMLGELEKYGLTDFFFSKIMPLHKIYMDMEAVGLAVDLVRREEVRSKYRGLDLWAMGRFQNVTGYAVVDADEQKIVKKADKKNETTSAVLNINSPKQVKSFITNVLKYPERADTAEDTLVALIGNHSKPGEMKREALELLLEMRGVKKALSTYIDAELDYDGRLRTSYRICGTETGRSSTNVLKPPVRPTQSGLAFQTITKHGEIGPEIREYIIPDPGYVFMECDASQAEARIVANLAEDADTLKLFDTTDIHSLTATWIFKIPMEQVNKKTHRFIGKTVRHAGNYDMRKNRLMLDTNKRAKKYGIPVSISEHEADLILKAFHTNTPKIRGVFHHDIEKALRDFGMTLINPFGRRRQFLGRLDSNLYREAYAQIPQSTVRDLVIRALIYLRERYPDIRIILESHDALLALVPEDMISEYAAAMKYAFELPIDFSQCSLPREPLIIPAEIQIGRKNYRELEKYVA
jgi:DNA polymerase I-like protein with 3'-5' exonuclease and polymerase domains